MSIKNIINLKSYPLNIKWRMTECCNYDCSYCVRKRHKKDISLLNEDEENISYVLTHITRLIHEKKVDTMVELMGGEVSLFNLKNIIDTLYTDNKEYLKEIFITTNFSLTTSYYQELIEVCNEHNIKLTLVLSFHSEYTTLSDFIEKVKSLSLYEKTFIKLEMVSLVDNKDLVLEFINKCEENNLIYDVDGDIKESNHKDKLIIQSNNEPMYKVEFDDGSIEYCNSMREISKKYANYNTLCFIGYECSLDYTCVNIEGSNHIGFKEGKFPNCKTCEPLENFHLKDKCTQCTHGCSLCGWMSVYKKENE